MATPAVTGFSPLRGIGQGPGEAAAEEVKDEGAEGGLPWVGLYLGSPSFSRSTA